MTEQRTYSNTVFSVAPTPDLAMTEIYMDEAGVGHLMLGHRDMGSIILTGVQTAVENPTEVYLSTSVHGRFVFKSTNVTTKSGRPMAVVVQREDRRGRVVTATPHSAGSSGELVWESTGTLYSNYDKASDLLYVSKGAAREAYAVDEAEGRIWLRKAEDDDTPVGVTIFDLRAYWKDHLTELKGIVANFLSVMPGEIEIRIQNALGV